MILYVGVAGDNEIYFHFNYSFNNQLLFQPDQIGKYIYGAIRVELDIYIPNPNTNKFSWYGGIISGEPIITETLKIYPYIESTSSNHYNYALLYIFDGYQPQNIELPGPLMTISNVRARWVAAAMPTNEGLSGTGTCTQAYNNLRVEDTPLNRGLASLIAEGIDNSVAVDLMLQYLYDIKMNDLQYYQSLTSQISTLVADNQYQSERLRLILSNMINGFIDVQTVLDLFPSYRTQVLQYWQELLQMNAQQSSEAAERESQYADRESQSDQLLNGMNSITLPSISAGDLDILSNVDTTQKTNFFGLIALITHTTLVTKIMLIIVIGSIIGYILYGKK